MGFLKCLVYICINRLPYGEKVLFLCNFHLWLIFVVLFVVVTLKMWFTFLYHICGVYYCWVQYLQMWTASPQSDIK